MGVTSRSTRKEVRALEERHYFDAFGVCCRTADKLKHTPVRPSPSGKGRTETSDSLSDYEQSYELRYA